MANELLALVTRYGLLIVFAATFAEQAGFPVPALPILVVAGAVAAHGGLPLAGVVAAALAGCLLPDLLWYWTGRRMGPRVMHGLCKLSLSPDSCIHRSELHFERWRGRSLIIAKFVPGLSVVAPPLVGALGLRLRSFLLLDGAGSLLWLAVGTGLGVAFADQIDRVLVELANASKLVLAVTICLVALYVLGKWLHRRRVRAALQTLRITRDELRRALDSDQPPLVLDVRSRTSRTLDPAIVAGAVLADSAHLDATLAGVPLDRDIITYCSCPNEATSARAAVLLHGKGYRRARPLLGGLAAWKAAGYALGQVPEAPAGDAPTVAAARP